MCGMRRRRLTTYNGRIEKLKANKMYNVGYWGAVESYDDAVDYDMSMYSIAVDWKPCSFCLNLNSPVCGNLNVVQV